MMKQICILLTKYFDWISSLVYYIGGQGYTHSSIALGDQPTQFYSFNYRGFAVETTEKHRRRGVRCSRCTGRIIISVLSLWQNSYQSRKRCGCPESRASTCPIILYACWRHSPAWQEWNRILFKIKIEY